MRFIYSDYFERRLKKRISKDPGLKRKVAKQLKLLKIDFNYPSLKTHKLKGARTSEHAIWIEGDLRLTFIIVKEGLLLTDIIKHDEY